MAEKKVFIKNSKEQFVPAEFKLLKLWSPLLENLQKGTVLIYLQIQTGINRESGNENEGKSWIGRGELCRRCNISQPTLTKIFQILEFQKFISKSRRGLGKTNIYEILDLPELKTSNLTKESGKAGVFNNTIDINKVRSVQRAKAQNSDTVSLKKWNANHFGNFFKKKYSKKYNGTEYGELDGKERRQLKLLLTQYKYSRLLNLINYTIDNWEDLGLDGYPSIAAMYGYRRTWMPKAEMGGGNRTKKGQAVRNIDVEEAGW